MLGAIGKRYAQLNLKEALAITYLIPALRLAMFVLILVRPSTNSLGELEWRAIRRYLFVREADGSWQQLTRGTSVTSARLLVLKWTRIPYPIASTHVQYRALQALSVKYSSVDISRCSWLRRKVP